MEKNISEQERKDSLAHVFSNTGVTSSLERAHHSNILKTISPTKSGWSPHNLKSWEQYSVAPVLTTPKHFMLYWKPLTNPKVAEYHHIPHSVKFKALPTLWLLTSSSLPLCIDQMNISKESWEPAATISPLESTAKHENWLGRGDVKVRKFRYLLKRWKQIMRTFYVDINVCLTNVFTKGVHLFCKDF